MSKFLVEIGTEELPYSFISSAMEQLEKNLKEKFEENNIKYSSIKTNATPRRLVALIDGLDKVQPDTVKEIKGPPAKIAFDENNNPTGAAIGFAKKIGVDPSILGKTTIDGVEYVYAKIEEKGKNVTEVLENIIPECVLKIQGPHFMRWADLDVKFQRPIRWIVALFDKEVVNIEIAGIKASNTTRAHRFNPEKTIVITDIDEYKNILRKNHVIVDVEERMKKVEEEAHKAAEQLNCDVLIEPELLKEVTNLTEWPIAVIGDFNENYLKIPDAVTVTVMATHQRYFPVYDKQGNLKNNFITMSNYIGDEFQNIKEGNQRVITARLDDAIFFYEEDRKTKLAERTESLKGITFQKGLGSLYDKVQRIKELSAKISDKLELSETDKANVQRTAELCKCDLHTKLVFEFTELQGVLGAHYALKDGEEEVVSKGVEEHYFPLGSDSALAETVTGQVVGIADKVDTITSVFSIGKIPTGSADPLGLRRASIGIMQTILAKNLNIDIEELIDFSMETLNVPEDEKADLKGKIVEFMLQRLKGIMTEVKYDVLDACFSAKAPLKDLNDLKKRIDITNEIINSAEYTKFHEAANRIIKLIKDNNETAVDSSLFVKECENKLYEKALELNNISDYSELKTKLFEATPLIENFFDEILVMDKDEKLKTNKINLLTNLKNNFFKIADFTKIVA